MTPENCDQINLMSLMGHEFQIESHSKTNTCSRVIVHVGLSDFLMLLQEINSYELLDLRARVPFPGTVRNIPNPA